MKCQILPHFSPSVCFSFSFKKEKKLLTIPWSALMLEVSLRGNQSALIRETRGPEGRGLRWDGRIRGRLWLLSRLRSSVFVNQWEWSGSLKKKSFDMRSSRHLTDFPNSASPDKEEFDLSVLAGCRKGINVTVFRFKIKKNNKEAEIDSYSWNG